MKPVNVGSLEVPGLSQDRRVESTSGPDGFGQELKSAVSKVDELQVQADAAAGKLGAGEGNLHETMLALEKADVAMRLALKVRNKLVDAYNEVMRMSV